MSRIAAIEVESSTGKARHLLDGVKAKLGTVPNMMRVMANSEAVLQGYLGLSGALGAGLLNDKLRQELALVTGQSNGCDYCLSAHTFLGKAAGLTDSEIVDARTGTGIDERSTVALKFATEVLKQKGQVSTEQLQAVRSAGFSEGEIAEIIAHVALNVFTNYFNIAAGTDIDFPKVSAKELAR
jgi:uncharacterized peroxidase-related enzyme